MSPIDVKALLQSASLVSGRKPRVVVIGGSGKAGSGVVEFAKDMGVEVTVWGRAETAKGGPFPELLEFGACVPIPIPVAVCHLENFRSCVCWQERLMKIKRQQHFAVSDAIQMCW